MGNQSINYVVDSMNFNDLINLYRQDIPFVNHKIEENNKKIKNLLWHKEIFFFKPIEYKRKSGITIVLQYIDRGPNVAQKDRMGIWIYYWFLFRGGVTAIRLVIDPNSGLIPYLYTSHFLDRYRERFLKDPTNSKPEVMNIYLRRNHRRWIKKIPSKIHPNGCWILSNDGVSFMEVKQDSHVVMKTFLPYDILNLKQNTIASSMSEEIAKSGYDADFISKLEEEEKSLEDYD